MENSTKYLDSYISTYTSDLITEGRAIDLFVAYRFLRILTTPWDEQDAFKHGIIDENGKLLRKSNTLNTEEEKKSFTLLHRLVFNLKRILHKVPGVKSKIGTYATALFMLKEHNVIENEQQQELIEEMLINWLNEEGVLDTSDLLESVMGIGETLPKGKYKLTQDIFTDKSEIKGSKGDLVVAFSDTASNDEVLGQDIFKVVHQRSKEEIYVALEDLEDA
jgi:hypothetical protein